MLDNVFLCPHQSAKNVAFYLHGWFYIIDFPSGKYLIGAPVEQIEGKSSQICFEQLQENEPPFLQRNADSQQTVYLTSQLSYNILWVISTKPVTQLGHILYFSIS